MHGSLRLSRRRLKAELWARGPSFPGFRVLPTGDPRARLVGSDPLRIAIVGGGLGAGFGARDHDRALTGQLAAAVHDQLGCGVVVTSRVQPRIAIGQVPESLGAAGALTFQAVVYTPNISSAISDRPKVWNREARAMVEYLRTTGGPDLPVVLAGLPPFRLAGPHQQRVEQERLEQERAVSAFATASHRVAHAVVTTSPDLDVDVDYSAFYASFAADVSRALMPMLMGRTPASRTQSP